MKQVMAISDVVVTRNIGSIEITLINSHCFTIRSSRLANRFFFGEKFAFVLLQSIRHYLLVTSPSDNCDSLEPKWNDLFSPLVMWSERERGGDQVVMRGE